MWQNFFSNSDECKIAFFRWYKPVLTNEYDQWKNNYDYDRVQLLTVKFV